MPFRTGGAGENQRGCDRASLCDDQVVGPAGCGGVHDLDAPARCAQLTPNVASGELLGHPGPEQHNLRRIGAQPSERVGVQVFD